MSQNISSAVMQSRVSPHDSLDFFPTPPWATRALLAVLSDRIDFGSKDCWEPACGQGHMVRPLSEYFARVFASDVHPYGFGQVLDFLFPFEPPGLTRGFDWIITNPPFRLGLEFALTAIERARDGVALLVRTSFLEGGERHARLFSKRPPSLVLQYAERVPMAKGKVDGTESTATSYCWLVWMRRGARLPLFTAPSDSTQLVWIPPCRRDFERPGDYLLPEGDHAASDVI